MRFIFLIILVYKISQAENSESKYIDLLPDKEKNEFLETIARRILEEVQVKNDRPKHSGEIPEDQLNEHDAYVRKLLKEEAENLRRKAGEATNKNSDLDISVVALDKKEDINNDDRYDDLTLPTENGNKKVDSRQIFTGFSMDNDKNSDQDRDSRDESDVDIQVKNIKTSTKNAKKSTLEEIWTTKYSEDNPIATVVTTRSSLINSDNPLAGENWDSNQKINAFNIDTVSHNSDKYSEEYDPKSSKKPNDTVKYADKVLKHYVSGKKTSDVFYSITNSALTTVTETTETSSHNASSRFTRSSDDKELIINQGSKFHTSSAKKDNTLTEVLEKPKVINIELISATATTALTDTEVPYVIKNVSLTNTYQATTTGIEELINSSPVTQTKSKGKEIQALRDNNIYILNENTKTDINKVVIDLEKNNKAKINDKTLPQKDKLFLNGLINVLQQKLVEEDEHLDNAQLDKNKMKEYNVYEISPDSTPFVKQKIQQIKPKATKITIPDNKEHPYYVPIYNYSPNNAFYNPHNIFGPNNDDYKDKDHFKIIKDNDNENDSYKIDKDNDDIQTTEKDKNNNLNKFEWDYYISHNPHLKKIRFGLKDPNSDIDNHPERSERQNLKSKGKTSSDSDSSSSFDIKLDYSTDTVRQIRQLLFQMKNWGYKQPTKDWTTTTAPEYVDSDKSSETVEPVGAGESFKPSRTGKIPKNVSMRSTKHGPYYIRYTDQNRTFRIPLSSKTTQKLTNEEKGKETDYDLIKKVLDMVSEKEMMPILQKFHEVDIKKTQRSREISADLDVYVTVMSDLIKENNRGLRQYDWLATTVQLQSAIKKMVDMAKTVQSSDDIHPSDLELLKYLVFLHNSAKEELNIDVIGTELRSSVLPKTKSKKKKGFIKDPLLNRAWLIRMLQGKHVIPDEELENFEEFLDDLQVALYDLHTAFKYISIVTTYKNQKGFEKLLQLQNESKRQKLLELILHMCTARLLKLIETTSQNGLEDNYLDYIKRNEKEVARTKDEFVFVLKLVEELKQIK